MSWNIAYHYYCGIPTSCFFYPYILILADEPAYIPHIKSKVLYIMQHFKSHLATFNQLHGVADKNRPLQSIQLLGEEAICTTVRGVQLSRY